jgi:predicted dehydrogenase
MTARSLRLGMVGGGDGAFIGAVHRIAARLDVCYEVVAGALSSDAERAAASGAAIRLDPARCYSDYREMARAEAARTDGIDVVAIVTPNHMHAPVAKAFLDAGIHVICDKPLGISLAEGEELAALAHARNRVFALTHT